MVERYVHWNEDIGEWQLKCVAYTGNNMRKQVPAADTSQDKEVYFKSLNNIFVIVPGASTILVDSFNSAKRAAHDLFLCFNLNSLSLE